ncbi:MAG: copper resistance protein B [Pseudomonadota bacterium]
MIARLIPALIVLALATPVLAQHQGHPAPTPAPAAPAAREAPPATDRPAAPAADPAEAEVVGDAPAPPPPSDHAADAVFGPSAMARARGVLRREHGGTPVSMALLGLAEGRVAGGEDGFRWDGEYWWGGDRTRLVLKSEGESADGELEAAELQVLASRPVGPYFDLQLGLRRDFASGPRRTYLVAGFEGVAPYWIETGGALFLSDEGELLGRLEGVYDLRLTQRWILQPRAEIELSAGDVQDLGLGAGVTDVELGLRLRYEVTRTFAPYVGVAYDRRLGGTADLARAAGERVEATGLVIGLRAFF